MRKHCKSAALQAQRRTLPPVFSDNPADDDPHDTFDQELLGIWLSISRLRQLIRPRPPRSRVVSLRRLASTKTASRRPRRKAA